MDAQETTNVISICVTVLLCFAILVIGPSYCTIREGQFITDQVKSGADPLAAACAIHGMSGDYTCTVLAAHK